MADDYEDVNECCHRAAHGDTEGLESLLLNKPELLNCKDTSGQTVLMHAALNGQHEILKLLINHGADLDQQDSCGRTALLTACYQGWYEGLVTLLGEGASSSISDNCGRLPLHACTYDAKIRTLAFLLQNMSSLNLDSKDCEDMTPLHWAAFHGRPDHVQLLISKGATLAALDFDKKTPLHWAAQNGQTSCVELILLEARGTNLVNQRDKTGKGTLHYAAAAGHADTVEALFKSRATDVNLDDPSDRQPIHWAAAMGREDVVSVLLAHGANPRTLDLKCKSALYYSEALGHRGCMEIMERHLGIAKEKKLEKHQSQKSTKEHTHLKAISSEKLARHTVIASSTNSTQTLRELEQNLQIAKSVQEISGREKTLENSQIVLPPGETNGMVETNGKSHKTKENSKQESKSSKHLLTKNLDENFSTDSKYSSEKKLPPLRGSNRQRLPAVETNGIEEPEEMSDKPIQEEVVEGLPGIFASKPQLKLPKSLLFKPATTLYSTEFDDGNI